MLKRQSLLSLSLISLSLTALASPFFAGSGSVGGANKAPPYYLTQTAYGNGSIPSTAVFEKNVSDLIPQYLKNSTSPVNGFDISQLYWPKSMPSLASDSISTYGNTAFFYPSSAGSAAANKAKQSLKDLENRLAHDASAVAGSDAHHASPPFSSSPGSNSGYGTTSTPQQSGTTGNNQQQNHNFQIHY